MNKPRGPSDERDWTRAMQHFDEVKSQYVALLGTPGVMVGPALMLTFEPLARRFAAGERTQALYDALMAVE